MEIRLYIYTIMLVATVYCLQNRFIFSNNFQEFLLKIYPFLLYAVAIICAFHPLYELSIIILAALLLIASFFIAVFHPTDMEKESVDTFTIIIIYLPITFLSFFMFNCKWS